MPGNPKKAVKFRLVKNSKPSSTVEHIAMLYLMLCGPGFMGALAMVGIPPQGSPSEYVFLFLTGFGAVASLVALTWPKHGSFMLRGFLFFLLLGVLLTIGLSVRDVIRDAAYGELPILVTIYSSLFALMGLSYRALRRDARKNI